MNLLPPELRELEESLTPTQLQQLRAKQSRVDRAAKDFSDIQTSIEWADIPFQLYTIDLTNGYDMYNPFEISVPFKSMWVYAATDTAVSAKLHLNSKKIPHIINGLPIAKNFAVSFPSTVGVAYITAPAQSGKTISIVVVKDGTITPGLTLSQNAGGVAINEGSSLTTRDRTGLDIASLGRTIICPVNTSRNSETIVNYTGQSLWLGDANVTDDTLSYPGIRVDNGDAFVWKNTAALYAYNPGGALTDAKIARNYEA